MILSKKRITKALIRLRECAGWSAPVLFANPRRQVFSRRGPNDISQKAYEIILLGEVLLKYKSRLQQRPRQTSLHIRTVYQRHLFCCFGRWNTYTRKPGCLFGGDAPIKHFNIIGKAYVHICINLCVHPRKVYET